MTERSPGALRIVMLGDTSFGEPYHDRLASAGREPVLRTRGRDYMIENFAEMLSDSDCTVANLETPITDAFPSPLAGEKKYLHYADVTETPAVLRKHGIDLVSLANNHMLDFGERGLEQTREVLTRHGIRSSGAGSNAIEAGTPHVMSFDFAGRTFKIALLCSFERRAAYAERYAFYAGPDRGGVNGLSTEKAGAAVRALRREHPDIFIIAYPHWGSNCRWVPDRQRAQARALLDAGVDLIVGHGAHLLQELEQHEGRWIVYGLGNFVFASPGRYAGRGAHPYSAIATLILAPAGAEATASLRLHPTVTDNRLTDYRSRFVTAEEFEKVMLLLRERTAMSDASALRATVGEDKHGHFLELALGQV